MQKREQLFQEEEEQEEEEKKPELKEAFGMIQEGLGVLGKILYKVCCHLLQIN